MYLFYIFSILVTFPFPPVTTLIADTIAAVCGEPVACCGVGVPDGTAAAAAITAGAFFLTTTSSGAYLFTSAINPFPRYITIMRIMNTVVIPTAINKKPVCMFSI